MQTIANALDPNGSLLALTAAEGRQAPIHVRAKEIAGQFEQIFVQQVVTSMRASSDGLGGSMFGGGAGSDTYSAWFDRCMSENLGRSGGLGLATKIAKNILQHATEVDYV
ncbi:MAG: rod-binding protein [Planctomycetota bacterium]